MSFPYTTTQQHHATNAEQTKRHVLLQYALTGLPQLAISANTTGQNTYILCYTSHIPENSLQSSICRERLSQRVSPACWGTESLISAATTFTHQHWYLPQPPSHINTRNTFDADASKCCSKEFFVAFLYTEHYFANLNGTISPAMLINVVLTSKLCSIEGNRSDVWIPVNVTIQP